jgi:hypothetical protein
MKKGIALFYTAFVVLGVLSAGCGAGGLLLLASVAGSHHNNTSGILVDVTPRTAEVAPNGTQQFAATVTGTANQTVIWSVSRPDRGSVSATGLYTATEVGGWNFVTAFSAQDRSSSFSVEINHQ